MSNKISRIFEAAIDVFSEYGFEKAKMDEIAERANVAKGTIYYHFISKEEIFLSLIEEEIKNLLQRLNEGTQSLKTGKEKLEKAIAILVDYIFEYEQFMKILLSEVWGSEERQIRFRERLQKILKLLQNYIEQGIQEGDYRTRNLELTASSIFGIISVTCLHTLLGQLNYSPKQITEHVQSMIHESLKK
ncbi:TetR/AcrR family transcriptional regulator [Tepidibacillus sp. LV47]|uniref:TetR/AcrR family transcriptional regulator n=1 Tax=Tepidibacillus sp. LV47 TaxID=3398228 RepID=UPI003AABBB99